MNKMTTHAMIIGGLLIAGSAAYAKSEPGINLRAGLAHTSVDVDINDVDDSDNYIALELNGTVSVEKIFGNIEIKTAPFEDESIDAFSFMGGYRLSEQATMFGGLKFIDYEDAFSADGFFAGYSYLIPLEQSALVLSGALGFLKADLDEAVGLGSADSDYSLGYNLKVSYLYPLDDRLTVSGDVSLYKYTYEFETDFGDLDLEESNFAIGVTLSYTLQ